MKGNILLLASLFSGSVMAGPIYSTSCPVASEITMPSKSGGFYMSNDCKTAYILPPMKGIATVEGKASGDLGRCSEITQFNGILTKINKEIKTLVGKSENDEEIKKLFDQRSLAIEKYGDLANTLGLSVDLNFSTAIDEQLESYRDLNQGLGVNFQPVAIKNAKLAWASGATSDSQMKIAMNQSIVLPEMNQAGAGSFSGRLDLSLFGACPLRDPFTGNAPSRLKYKDVAGLITPNFHYQYELEATYKYKATYNLSTLASKIRQVSSKGGLFKTSSYASLRENAESLGWFKLEVECDDPRVCENVKADMAVTIKNRLIKEVFDNIALSTIGANLEPIESGTPGKNGAEAGAEALRKCPNVYCQAGAVVLDVANSIFGGTSKTDDYIKTSNRVVIEEVQTRMPVTFNGMMGFGKN